jgi:hypothetical protein
MVIKMKLQTWKLLSFKTHWGNKLLNFSLKWTGEETEKILLQQINSSSMNIKFL